MLATKGLLLSILISAPALAQDAGADPCAKERAAIAADGKKVPASEQEAEALGRAHDAQMTALSKCISGAMDRLGKEQADAERKQADDFANAQREQTAQEEAEAAASYEQKAKDAHNPKIGGLALAGASCFNAAVRAEALQEIAKEKKYSKVGGAIDLRLIHENQDIIRDADSGDATIKTARRQAKLKTLPSCSDARVRRVVACLRQGHAVENVEEQSDGPDAECDDGDVGRALGLLPVREYAGSPVVLQRAR